MSNHPVTATDVITDESPYQVLPELDAEEFRALKEDIAERGVLVPVSVDEDGYIIDGYHRMKAVEELDISDPPVKVRDGLTRQEKRSLAYRLNMQRRQIDTESKKSLIKKRLNELIDSDVDKSDEQIAEELACTQQRVSQVRKTVVNEKISDGGNNTNVCDFTTVSDYATSEQKDRIVKDLLVENPEKSDRAIANQIGVSHPTVSKKRSSLTERFVPQLLNTDTKALLPQIPENTFDLILTDPPYGVDFSGNRYDTAQQDGLDGDADTALICGVASELSRILKPDRHCYVCCRWDVTPDVIPAYRAAFDSVDTAIVWDKDKGGHGMGDLNDWAPRHELILKCSNGSRELMSDTRPPNVIRQQDVRFTDEEKSHPTQKPVELFKKIIRSSADDKEVVFDPFGGVHTTAAAALETGRVCVSVEVDVDHHAVGASRISELTAEIAGDRTIMYDNVEVLDR
jgi:DNA modification methylase